MRAPKFLTRAMLRPLRILRAAGTVPNDTHSPEYLYLVQQSKRISLVRTLNCFGTENVRAWPLLLASAFVKWLDLILSSSLIRSLINEYDLLHRIDGKNVEKRL
jgi:hypothetical protein